MEPRNPVRLKVAPVEVASFQEIAPMSPSWIRENLSSFSGSLNWGNPPSHGYSHTAEGSELGVLGGPAWRMAGVEGDEITQLLGEPALTRVWTEVGGDPGTWHGSDMWESRRSGEAARPVKYWYADS
jgi:hypothetical protein